VDLGGERGADLDRDRHDEGHHRLARLRLALRFFSRGLGVGRGADASGPPREAERDAAEDGGEDEEGHRREARRDSEREEEHRRDRERARLAEDLPPDLGAERALVVLARDAGDDEAGSRRDEERRDLRDETVADREEAVEPIARPPTMLTAVITMPAIASPFTNFMAPSIAP
jgi:hypothetical protein